ncbi:related to TAF9-TFIID and SAGA subunit [Sporisorium reilianum SRZ2]|uniref:Related to TAF9-TFIID and SAGA subunit n=1 Tax=Sporisorium reilianum (strain SRZ2) TaxID=999809 RepID=E6ZWG6_SPORE|nr:related to TAF9-TFIID and SAGA subunit [Sporisorium reilianum SRZ2]
MVAYHDPASASSSSSYNDTGLRGPVPRDARLIALILASMGVSDVEPAVLLQLLEFAHRYTYDVLSDALVYADHANARQAGSNLSLEDVNLAIQSRVNYSFTKPPEKDMLLALASTVNAIPLPPISDRHGVRLPPAQHCLTNVNFAIVPNPPPHDFDDFQDPQRPSTASAAAASQSTQADTQASALFDTAARAARADDYDDDDDGDVSMTTVQPSQSQPDAVGAQRAQPVEADDGARGVKRSLDEDDEYD